MQASVAQHAPKHVDVKQLRHVSRAVLRVSLAESVTDLRAQSCGGNGASVSEVNCHQPERGQPPCRIVLCVTVLKVCALAIAWMCDEVVVGQARQQSKAVTNGNNPR
jgi:hypothetical protein